MQFENNFDAVVLNEDLEEARKQAQLLVDKFIHGQ
jgi:hypothetical protein